MTKELHAKVRVVAVVAPGAYNNARYDFDFSEWKPSDNSDIMRLTREFAYAAEDRELLKSIDELQRIILALFLCDSIPRKIHFFERAGDEFMPDGNRYLRVFGQPHTWNETQDSIILKSSSRLGIFNSKPLQNIDYVAPESEIISWYAFLSQTENSHISSSLQLVMESFRLAHELWTKMRVTDFSGLITILLLLVAGLESLFTKGSDSNADISLKFQTVGAVFYSKYVDTISLTQNCPHRIAGKFSYTDFKKVLKILYNLRSRIAHGSLILSFIDNKKVKELDDLFCLVLGPGGEVPKDKTGIYYVNLLTALGLLECHILEIYKGAKESLNKGVDILDEVLGVNTNSAMSCTVDDAR
jgi:hypothetical protein